MGDILPFKRQRPSERHKGKSLCAQGFHKWLVDKTKSFDVKQGKLVTTWRCGRCGATKTRPT